MREYDFYKWLSTFGELVVREWPIAAVQLLQILQEITECGLMSVGVDAPPFNWERSKRKMFLKELTELLRLCYGSRFPEDVSLKLLLLLLWFYLRQCVVAFFYLGHDLPFEFLGEIGDEVLLLLDSLCLFRLLSILFWNKDLTLFLWLKINLSRFVFFFFYNVYYLVLAQYILVWWCLIIICYTLLLCHHCHLSISVCVQI